MLTVILCLELNGVMVFAFLHSQTSYVFAHYRSKVWGQYDFIIFIIYLEVLIQKNKLILLFSKDSLSFKTFTLMHKNSIANKCCSLEESNIYISRYHKNIKQNKIFSTKILIHQISILQIFLKDSETLKTGYNNLYPS